MERLQFRISDQWLKSCGKSISKRTFGVLDITPIFTCKENGHCYVTVDDNGAEWVVDSRRGKFV